MFNKEENQKITSTDLCSQFGTSLTGMTTQFFTNFTDNYNESFDISKEYLQSQLSNKSQLYGQALENATYKMEKVCLRFLVRLAFFKINNIPAHTHLLSEQELFKQKQKSLYKMELLIHKKIWVRLQKGFTKIAVQSKMASRKPQLPQKNGMKKLVQSFECLQTKDNMKMLIQGFEKLKNRHQLNQKIQIFSSIINDLYNKHLTVQIGLSQIKKISKQLQKYEIGFKTLQIFVNSSLLYAFNNLRVKRRIQSNQIVEAEKVQRLQPSTISQEKKKRISQKFQRVKGVNKQTQVLGNYGVQPGERRLKRSSQLRISGVTEGSQSSQLKFNKLTRRKNASFRSGQSSVASLTQKHSKTKSEFKDLFFQEIKIKQNFTFTSVLPDLSEDQLIYDQKKWQNFHTSKKLQYLRPQQFPLINNDEQDYLICLPIDNKLNLTGQSSGVNPHLRRQTSPLSQGSCEHLYFRKSKQFKKERKISEKEIPYYNEEKGNLQAVKSYYFPQQSPKSKDIMRFKSNKKIFQETNTKEPKFMKMNKAAGLKKNEKTKSNYQQYYSPQSQKFTNRYSRYPNSPIRKHEGLKQTKQQKFKPPVSYIPKEWKVHQQTTKKYEFSNNYFDMGKTTNNFNFRSAKRL